MTTRTVKRGALQTGAFLAGGVVAVIIGVGVGLPHLMKVGWSWTTLFGLVSLVGGLVLLGLGFRAGYRSASGRQRWFLAPTALVVLLVLAGGLLTLGQALAASWVPPIALGERDPADVGLTAEDVELRTADGVDLAAWYVPGENGAAVVLAHGAGSTRTAVLDHAAVLAADGYGVLLVDARGHGESDGRAMDLGWWGDEDLGAAVDFLVDRSEVDEGRIGVLGLSMGGEEALGALGADDRIAAVVAEGATVRVAGDKDWLSEEYGWRGQVQEALEAATTWWADLLSPAEPPATLRASVAAAGAPVLLITAEAVPDEAQAAAFIQGGSPDTVTVWTVAGADHTGGLRTEPEAWASRVTAFFDEALVTTG